MLLILEKEALAFFSPMPLPTPRLRRIEAPADSLIVGLYPGADLLDAYAVLLPDGATSDVGRLAAAVFDCPPAWLGG